MPAFLAVQVDLAPERRAENKTRLRRPPLIALSDLDLELLSLAQQGQICIHHIRIYSFQDLFRVIHVSLAAPNRKEN